MEWAGASDPASGKWVICDGRTLSIQTYPDLYAVLSTTWNTGGEPAGDFRIPDLRSRVTVGAGQGAGLTSRTLASQFGEEAHSLTTAELPSHTHTGVTGNNNHTHDITDDFVFGDTRNTDVNLSFGGSNTVINGLSYKVPVTDNEQHSHSFTSDGTGGGGAHANIQPSVAVHKIIRILR